MARPSGQGLVWKAPFHLTIPIFIGALLLLSASHAVGQKVLQLERVNAIKTKKYFIGDEMKVKLVDEDIWRTGVIMDLHIEENRIEYSFGDVYVEEIVFIRDPIDKQKARSARKAGLMTSAGIAGYVLVDQLLSDDPNTAFGVGLAATPLIGGLAAGPVIRLFSKKKIGRRRRFRLLDLTFIKEDLPPRS